MNSNNGQILQESLRIIYCSSEGRFKEIFGVEEGVKLWKRYREQYSRDVARFICEELRGSALARLGRYTVEQMGETRVSDGVG